MESPLIAFTFYVPLAMGGAIAALLVVYAVKSIL